VSLSPVFSTLLLLLLLLLIVTAAPAGEARPAGTSGSSSCPLCCPVAEAFATSGQDHEHIGRCTVFQQQGLDHSTVSCLSVPGHVSDRCPLIGFWLGFLLVLRGEWGVSCAGTCIVGSSTAARCCLTGDCAAVISVDVTVLSGVEQC